MFYLSTNTNLNYRSERKKPDFTDAAAIIAYPSLRICIIEEV